MKNNIFLAGLLICTSLLTNETFIPKRSDEQVQLGIIEHMQKAKKLMKQCRENPTEENNKTLLDQLTVVENSLYVPGLNVWQKQNIKNQISLLNKKHKKFENQLDTLINKETKKLYHQPQQNGLYLAIVPIYWHQLRMIKNDVGGKMTNICHILFFKNLFYRFTEKKES